MSLEKYSLKLPKAVYSGKGALGEISQVLATAGATKVAAFTDKGLRKLGLFDLVEEELKKSGIPYDIFDDLPAEPSYMDVQKVIDEFKQAGADFIVACGGGSVMDSAKLASVSLTDEYVVKDLLDDPKRAHKCVSLLAIPTTAGTGAECTPNAIVGVPERALKIGIVNDGLICDYVILDAEMIRNLPRSIAAATGVDAMCHAIECFTSNKANPLSDTFALEAFDLIMNNIVDACDNADAIDAKNSMQVAAFYGGVAITASGTTGVHALSYPLGGKYHIAHGVSNAMLLVPVMEFNEPACRELFARAWDRAYHGSEVLGSDEEKSKALVKWMGDIVAHLNIPTSLKEFGVDPADLDDLVDAGMQVTRLLVNNRREITAEDARAIYERVLQ
ncbi:MAG: iron-containing alcohol dehydrogenase [Atopobiaceae bacterium]|nr:iron-containing alcohol dehydrogenase [Atopobiaceae bacterium]